MMTKKTSVNKEMLYDDKKNSQINKCENLFIDKTLDRNRRKKEAYWAPHAVIKIPILKIININIVTSPYITDRSGGGEAAGRRAVAHIHRWKT